jgi:hypothetical protein
MLQGLAEPFLYSCVRLSTSNITRFNRVVMSPRTHGLHLADYMQELRMPLDFEEPSADVVNDLYEIVSSAHTLGG